MLSGNGRGCAGLACGVTAEYSGSCHFSSRPREKSRPSLARCPANLRRRQIVSGSAWNSSEPPVRLTTVHHHGTRARPKESVRGTQNWCFAALCHVPPLWAAIRSCTSRERHSLIARCHHVFVGIDNGSLGSARRYLVGSSEAAVEHGVEELWWAIVFLQIMAGWVFFRAADR